MKLEFISIDRGFGIEQWPVEGLEGPLDSLFEDENEKTFAREYKLDGKVVHRSVHVHLKKGLGIEAALGNLGG